MDNPTSATIVQAVFAAGGIIAEKVLKRVHELCCAQTGAEEEFDVRIMLAERDLLKPLDWELKKCRSEATGSFQYVLVSRDPGSVAAEASPLHDRGTAFYQLLNAVFETDRCEGASEGQLRRILQASQQNEDAVQHLLANKWIEQDRGRVYITQRTLYNHHQFIIDNYGQVEDPRILKCLGCQEELLRGRLCSHLDCPARLHQHCYANYYRKHRLEAGTCPLQCGGTILEAARPSIQPEDSQSLLATQL